MCVTPERNKYNYFVSGRSKTIHYLSIGSSCVGCLLDCQKNGKSLCIACHLYARTMLIFSVLLKLTDVLPRTIVRQSKFSAIYIQLCENVQEKNSRLYKARNTRKEKMYHTNLASFRNRNLTKQTPDSNSLKLSLGDQLQVHKPVFIETSICFQNAVFLQKRYFLEFLGGCAFA